MRVFASLNVRSLAAVSLVAYALRVVVADRAILAADPRITSLLAWRSYGAIVGGTSLWVIQMFSTFAIPVGLVGLLANKRWGWWLLLAAYVSAWLASVLGGLTIGLALPRSLGLLSSAFGVSALVTYWQMHWSKEKSEVRGGL